MLGVVFPLNQILPMAYVHLRSLTFEFAFSIMASS